MEEFVTQCVYDMGLLPREFIEWPFPKIFKFLIIVIILRVIDSDGLGG